MSAGPAEEPPYYLPHESPAIGSFGMNLHRHVCRFALALVVAGPFLVLRDSAAADKSPREMFPASTVVYAEMPQPQKLIDAVLDHPSVAELQKHPDYQK